MRYRVAIGHVRGEETLATYTYEVDHDPDSYLATWQSRAASLLRKEPGFQPQPGDKISWKAEEINA